MHIRRAEGGARPGDGLAEGRAAELAPARQRREARELALGRDVRLTARLSTADVEAPLVFAGYGVSLPQAGMDDLAGLDLRGKIVVYVNANPAGLSAPLLAHALSLTAPKG